MFWTPPQICSKIGPIPHQRFPALYTFNVFKIRTWFLYEFWSWNTMILPENLSCILAHDQTIYLVDLDRWITVNESEFYTFTHFIRTKRQKCLKFRSLWSLCSSWLKLMWLLVETYDSIFFYHFGSSKAQSWKIKTFVKCSKT